MTLACSSEENDDSILNTDPLIGTWSAISMTEYPSNASEIVTEYTECQQKNLSTFLSNGTYEDVHFRENSEGVCGQYTFSHITVSQKWVKIGEGIYRFTEKYKQTSDGEIRISSTTPDKISFPQPGIMEIMTRGTNREINDPIDVEYYVQTCRKI